MGVLCLAAAAAAAAAAALGEWQGSGRIVAGSRQGNSMVCVNRVNSHTCSTTLTATRK
jgi:hypothetical protein